MLPNALPTPFIHWRMVLFGDTDSASIVYTPRFSHFCMEAAELWFRDCVGFDWYQMNVEEGRGTPVVHMETDFVAPLRGGDRLGVIVRVERLGRSTVTLLFEGIRQNPSDDTHLTTFTARFIFCFTDQSQGGAVPINDTQRELIEAYREACSPE
ncbi:acyl-CoA thioesterase [Pseudomaricurvus alkylphenolicus]|uniref:acyl-CoA thioesterase n=1 Tax=Pseudomaricurvus alkylphenolicus TaxID=1306991 RepID=UPI00141E3B3B|nr:thioesterase family protein [Pseudomaricurvus alkylphenolicus]NIB43469.1 acyl-CoA thioesterase [Pseudomaricurvus alkylphenolicus]